MRRVAFAVFALLGCGVVCGQGPEYESFEDSVPAYFVAEQAGRLSVSSWHSKHGKSLLRWEWSGPKESFCANQKGECDE